MFIPDDLYNKIVETMPIPVVDLVVVDQQGQVLLLKRENAPAKGTWWFPGGRILLGEPRKQAAERKLKEECGLSAAACHEMSTYDMLFEDCKPARHVVSTVYLVYVNGRDVILDRQSSAGEWHSPEEWENMGACNVVCYVMKCAIERIARVRRESALKDVLVYTA